MVKSKKACPTNFPSVNLRNTKISQLSKGAIQEKKASEREQEEKETKIRVISKPTYKVDIILS